VYPKYGSTVVVDEVVGVVYPKYGSTVVVDEVVGVVSTYSPVAVSK
jgi:hypothetical protein